MKFSRMKLCRLPSCYAVASIVHDGRTKLLVAPDDAGPCYCFDALTLEREMVWEGPGGTMSLVPIPSAGGEFLAVQRFFPGFRAEQAKIVRVSPAPDSWNIEPFLRLPFVHRFDILDRGGVRYLLCSTLCTARKSQDDWSSPGELMAEELTDNLSSPVSLKIVAGGMTRNHGYWRVQNPDFTSALTSCDQGVFEVLPPEIRGEDWIVRHILDRPVSDIALCDIDGDGVPELAAIEPFHGAEFNVYRRTVEGYTPVYGYPGSLEFCHVVWGGRLRGRPVFIGGCRGGDRELFLLRWENGSFTTETIESGMGPANVAVVNGDDYDLLLVANHEIGEAALFVVTDD